MSISGLLRPFQRFCNDILQNTFQMAKTLKNLHFLQSSLFCNVVTSDQPVIELLYDCEDYSRVFEVRFGPKFDKIFSA